MASVQHATTATTTTAMTATTRKNAGPLTTAFRAPSRCFDRTLDMGVFNTLDQGGYEYAQDLSMFVTDAGTARSLCPSAAVVPCLPGHGRHRGRGIFFSPGLACPSSWQTVASASAANASGDYLYVNGIVASTLLPGESAYVCCLRCVSGRASCMRAGGREEKGGGEGEERGGEGGQKRADTTFVRLARGFDYMVNFPPAPPVVYLHLGRGQLRRAAAPVLVVRGQLDAARDDADGRRLRRDADVDGRRPREPAARLVPHHQAVRAHHPAEPPAAGRGRRADGGGGGRGLGGATVGGAVALLALVAVALALARRRRRWGPPGRAKPELDAAGRPELEARELHELDAGAVAKDAPARRRPDRRRAGGRG